MQAGIPVDIPQTTVHSLQSSGISLPPIYPRAVGQGMPGPQYSMKGLKGAPIEATQGGVVYANEGTMNRVIIIHMNEIKYNSY